MNNNKLVAMKYIFEILLIIFLSFMYYLNQHIKTSNILYIPSGSINKIITHLGNKGYDVSKLDSLIIRLYGSPQRGWINFDATTLTRADFIYQLLHSKAALQKISLIPGETTYIFLNQLSSNLKLNRNKLQSAFKKHSKYQEGTFTPNTYNIPIGINEEELIKLLLKKSSYSMKKLSNKLFGTYDEDKWFRYVAIASVIEKESANTQEMPIVSSVIYNRIKKGMRLQMDGTLNYGKYSHIKVTPKRIREDNSPYNTYLHKGIPSQPVCNVSNDAIKAAIFPAKTNYLYFMKSKAGNHDFSSNYSTHLKNIKNATN